MLLRSLAVFSQEVFLGPVENRIIVILAKTG